MLSELELLRRLRVEGDIPASIFFQLKDIFHTLESLGSARIEGNHTTLADYIDSKVEGTADSTDQLLEVANIERAMDYGYNVVCPLFAFSCRRLRTGRSTNTDVLHPGRKKNAEKADEQSRFSRLSPS